MVGWAGAEPAVRGVALVVGAVRADAVPAVRELDVQRQGGAGRAARRYLRRSRDALADPAGQALTLGQRRRGVAGHDPEAGRERLDRAWVVATSPVVHLHAGRLHLGAVLVEGRHPIAGGVLTRPAARAASPERIVGRIGGGRGVAEELMQMRRTRLVWFHDRIVWRLMAEVADGGEDTPQEVSSEPWATWCRSAGWRWGRRRWRWWASLGLWRGKSRYPGWRGGERRDRERQERPFQNLE